MPIPTWRELREEHTRAERLACEDLWRALDAFKPSPDELEERIRLARVYVEVAGQLLQTIRDTSP